MRILARVALVALLALGALAAPAQADRPFTPRFSANDAGDITFVANALMSCPTAAPICPGARAGTDPTLSNLNNNQFGEGQPMGYVDVDADPTSFNSSTADLTLPAGATVLFAGLYYGGDYSRGSGGDPALDSSAAARRQVKFRAPGDAAYADLTASVLDDSVLDVGRYQAFADVTARVQAGGNGTYGVANVQAGTGSDRYAGWTLVIAYRDATQPPRNLTVFDGLVTIRSNDPPTSIPVSGFRTPPAGTVRSTVGFVAYEGDLGFAGDSASLLTSRGSFPLTDGQNPVSNYFNSSISRLGQRFTAKNPDHVNQLGFDADLLNADGFLGNGDTSATIRVTTMQDQYLPGVVTFSTLLDAPVVTPQKSVANVTNPNGPNRPGDTLRYTVTYTNSGQDEANNFILRDPIPANASYVPNTLRIVGGPNAPASPSDAAGDDLGEFDVANDVVRFRLGTGASATQGGTLGDGTTATNSVSVTFDVRIDPAARDRTEIVNAAFANFTGDALGTPFVDQKTPPVTTVVQVPDLALAKSHTPGGAFAGGSTVTFRLIASNVGSASTQGLVTVTDTFPASGFRGISNAGGAGWTCNITGLTLTCTRSDSVAAGDSYPAIVVDAEVVDPAPANIVNTARVSGGGDQNPANDTATDTGPGNSQADVSLTKVASPPSLLSGDTVTYTLVARNNGPSAADDVMVTDTLPTGTYSNVVATTTQGNCTTAVVCSLGPIARNREVTITISARVTTTNTTLTNTADVSSVTPDPVPTNNQATATVQILGNADVSIDKEGTPENPPVGSTFTYTLTVANAGPGVATSLEVTDDLPSTILNPVVAAPAGWTCNAPATGGTLRCTRATLANGASSAITVTGTIATSAGGSFFTNGASVTTTSTDPDSSNNTDSTTDLATAAADLSLTKAFSTNTRVNTGAAVSFQLVATNNGPSAATGVVISDPLPAGLSFVSSGNPACTFAGGTVTCTVGALAPGASFTATINARVTAAGSANLVNTATVSGNQGDPIPSNNTGQDTLIVNAAADVAVEKTAPPSAAVGANVPYALRVTNNGPDAAAAVVVADTLPAGATFVSATAPCTFAAGTVTCALGTLASGASRNLTVTVRYGASRAGQNVTNTAGVDTTTFDPDATNDSDPATVAIDPLADLAIVKTASVANPRVGQDVTYTLAVTNDGPSDATGVVVTDTLPAGVDLIRLDPGCQEALGVVTCAVGDIAAGQTVTRSITVQTTFGNAGSTVTNVASVDGAQDDPDSSDNSDTADVVVQEQIDLRLTKTALDATPAVGALFAYRLSVFNDGPSNATGVVIEDPLPTGIDFVSASPGCTVTARVVRCTVGAVAAQATALREVTVRATAAAAGRTLTNGATVAGNQPEVNPSNNQSSADVTVDALADLTVTKTADDATPVVGGRLTYVLAVANAGPNPATGVSLTDTLPAGLTLVSVTPTQGTCSGTFTCALGTIAAGAGAQVVVVTTVTGAAGTPIANSTSVAAAQTDPNPANNSATTTVTPEAAPPTPDGEASLSIDKTVDRKSAAVGDILNYEIRVRNRGDGPATEVRVTDTFTGAVDILEVRTPKGSCTQKPPIVCELGTLPAGADVTIRLRVRVTGASDLSNTATLQAADNAPIAGGNQDIAGTNVSSGEARLLIVKVANKSVVDSGGLVRFAIAISNRGPFVALDVEVCDRLPVGLSFVSAPGARFSNGRACWQLDRLGVKREKVFTVRARAQRTADGRRVRNVATVQAGNAPRDRAAARVRVRPAEARPGGVTG